MSKYIPGNQKHLTLEDRKYIEKSLNAGCSFKDIARYLCKDPTTISKEIRLHRLSDWYHKGCFNNAHNFCVHRYHCKKVNACGKIILCGVKSVSYTHLSSFMPAIFSSRLLHPWAKSDREADTSSMDAASSSDVALTLDALIFEDSASFCTR